MNNVIETHLFRSSILDWLDISLEGEGRPKVGAGFGVAELVLVSSYAVTGTI